MSPLYKPLDIESYQFRILSLCPGQSGTIIRCKLKRRSLINTPKYTALSYSWGDENIRREIIVNNIRTPVTVNLEEALQDIRHMNVTQVWVDALCINQKDKQEKSHQIRNMVYIYSKAVTTYAWLGGQTSKDATIAIQFLQKVCTGAITLEVLKHARAQDRASEPQQAWNPQSIYCSDQCKRCTLDCYFVALLNFHESRYWKRRWIIQEVTAAAQVQAIYGQEILTLENMATALDKCQRSEYWLPRYDVAYRYLQQILTFRESYHSGKHLTLCEAILSTQNSLSKDIRDRVFALIGICSDGTELVPTPSYSQDPAVVVRDMSRKLLRRNKCFDIIQIDQRKKSTSEILPTWAPDWLSPTFSKDAYLDANRLSLLSHNLTSESLRGNVNTLRLQGVVLGTIVGVTPNLRSIVASQEAQVRRRRSMRPLNRDHLRYYGRKSVTVTAAIIQCLTEEGTQPAGVICDRLEIHDFCQLVQERATYRSDPEHTSNKASNPAHIDYRQWINAYEDSMIHCQPLQRWITEAFPFYWTFRCLHTTWGLALRILLAFIVNMLPLLLFLTSHLIPGENFIWLFWQSFDPFFFFLGFFFLGWTIILWSLFFYIFYIVCWDFIDPSRKRLHNIWPSENPILERRLVVSDHGMLGMTYADAKVGDYICFLAGCTSASILRPREISKYGSQTEYEVVGKSFVCLSKKDQKISGILVSRRD